MQGNYLFEYAVIRVVPRVEREEFLNAGVILYCAQKKFLGMIHSINESRLSALCETTDIGEIRCNLEAFQQIAEGNREYGPIAALDPASRFRWLTAMRSTIIQTSRVHPGFCTDPEETLRKLYAKLVL
jgi:hypothetical protein